MFPFPRSDHISYTVHFVSNHVNMFLYFYIKLSLISWTVETFLFCVGSQYLQYAASGNGPHFIYFFLSPSDFHMTDGKKYLLIDQKLY